MKCFLYSLFLSMWISTVSVAELDSTLIDQKEEILDSYGSLLEDKVTRNLLASYKNYMEFPDEYWKFLKNTFLDNWDFDATTKALIGRDILSTLSMSQFQKLSTALEMTLIRYLFESLSFYNEQKLNVVDIKLNEQQTFVWLKINIESPRFPDIHLDLLLKRTNSDQWKGVDFRFKGITYINLKKNSYRQDFENLSFRGLLEKLDDKNKLFFKELCQSEANYIDPKKPPCMQNYDKKQSTI